MIAAARAQPGILRKPRPSAFARSCGGLDADSPLDHSSRALDPRDAHALIPPSARRQRVFSSLTIRLPLPAWLENAAALLISETAARSCLSACMCTHITPPLAHALFRHQTQTGQNNQSQAKPSPSNHAGLLCLRPPPGLPRRHLLRLCPSVGPARYVCDECLPPASRPA